MNAARLLSELIALPSINPAFVPANDPRAGEHRVADFLLATMASAGLDVERREVFPNRHNVLGYLSPSGKASARVLLAPHMDTVGGRDEQFTPAKKNGRIFGRGACDTKGSIAAMLTAILKVANSRARPRQTEIVFVGFMDEEDSQSGSRALVGAGFKADLAIVGEPTELQCVTAHKGDLWLKIETVGKAAHGAKPHLGKNAVHAMTPIVNWLEEDYAAELRRRSHPLLGSPTVNVGSIRGGTQPNVVPDRCEISIDRRTIPGETEASVIREIKAFLKSRPDARLLNSKCNECWPMETDIRNPLVAQFMSTVGQRKPLGVDFFCDGAVLSAGGIPSVVFGPGDIAQAHTSDEWISLKSLDGAVAILTRFLQSLP